MTRIRILAADHVLPITSDPIQDGAVAIKGSRIAAVGTRNEITEQFPDHQLTELGEAAIIPGLVNCHSHLEITALRGLLDSVEHDFRRWLLKLNDTRAELSEEDITLSAAAGAVEGARAGVTCFGDIGRFGAAGLEALKSVGLRGVVFQETEFSPDNRTAADDLAKLKAKFLELRERGTPLVEVGLSPHSPYTVSTRLFEGISEYARSENTKVTIHAGESAEEDDLMKENLGFFTEIYRKFGVEWQSPGCSSFEFLSRTGILETRPLLAHCVTASENDIRLIAESRSRIAHCPKSNAKFGHGTAPFEQFLDAGIAAGLGSDSVASNNACDLLEEARFAALASRNRPGRSRLISAGEVLKAATLGGAKALGLEDLVGSLETGKQADLTVVSLSNIAQQPVHDIAAALVFSSNSGDIRMTLVAGETVYVDGEFAKPDTERVRRRLKEIETRLRTH